MIFSIFCKNFISEADYFVLQFTVSFGPDETSQNLTVFTIDDDIAEFQESLSLNIKISNQLKDIGVLPRNFITTINITDNDSEW